MASVMEDNEAAVKHFERAAEVARSEGDENAATYKVRSDQTATWLIWDCHTKDCP